MVSTTTPLERSESRVHRAGTFFSPLSPTNIVKFHFTALARANWQVNELTIAVSSTRLLQIRRRLSAPGLRYAPIPLCAITRTEWIRIGRYKIVRELGRGAMGVVYHAIDPNIGRPVAIKTINLATVLKPDEQERMRERLFREARSAGILSHPGIVTIYDVEQQGDLAYIAMEYVDGPTLDQLLSQPQPCRPDRMFSILAQTAVALDYAHGKGIVHRDVKPANIMIAANGTAKITDFGIAKITASEQFTMTGSIVGTPHYMSPEQVQGQAVDGRSDQFSLAVIAFEMLTGEKPYTGEHLTTVVYKIVAEEPPSPHRINSSLGSGLKASCEKGLSKKPDGRYAPARSLSEAGTGLRGQ
jgi:serine/threonine protein kinase